MCARQEVCHDLGDSQEILAKYSYIGSIMVVLIKYRSTFRLLYVQQ